MRATRYSFALPRPKIAGAPATSLNISRFGNGRSLPAAPASDAIPPPMCTSCDLVARAGRSRECVPRSTRKRHNGLAPRASAAATTSSATETSEADGFGSDCR